MENLIILNLNTSSINQYKNCFDLNGSPKKLENIEWQFFKSTKKKGFVNIAFDEINQKVAAIYAISCVKFKIGKELFLGTQSLDTITDINYRGKGLFISLAKDVYEKAKQNEVKFVYGFPNGNSIYGFQKKLDWEVLDPVPFMIKPIKTSYFSRKISVFKWLPNFNVSFSKYKESYKFRIEENFSFPEMVTPLWESFANQIEVAVQRDKKYLDWRYIQKPFENYKIAHCYSENNTYLGYIVYAIKEKHGGKIAYIMELIFDLKSQKAGRKLLQYAIDQIKKDNADCILSWCMDHSPNYNVFKKEFFFKLPGKFRPIELHFGARAFNKELAPIINNRNNWYLSYSDSDTV
jgi:predicted acetyltransferase